MHNAQFTLHTAPAPGPAPAHAPAPECKHFILHTEHCVNCTPHVYCQLDTAHCKHPN